MQENTLCELGMYAVYLSDANGMLAVSSLPAAASSSSATSDTGSMSREGVFNKYAGYLLRVKPVYSDEGGVAAGYSVLSSPSLVE